MSEKLVCPICFEEIISRDGHAKITSGCCNYTFHYNCYLKYIKSQNKNDCPMCRSIFDKNTKDKYDIEILNGPSESIIIEIFPTRNYSINEIAKEVAFLFFGIFLSMIPALQLLETAGSNIAEPLPHSVVYWASGLFSSVLDNAPTYVNFLALSLSMFGLSVNNINL